MKRTAEGDFGEFLTIGGNAIYPGYIIKGRDRNLMIDSGINFMGPAYIASFEKIFGDRNALDWVFATHSHYDHVGSIPYLKRKLPRLKAGASGRVGELMKKESVLRFMTALSEPHRENFYHIAGEEDVSLQPVDFDFQLKEGDRFDLGGVTCEVYEVPGHTRDSLAFFIPEIRAIFAGEAYGTMEGAADSAVRVEFLFSYDDYVRSLRKMIALKPRLLGMAHWWVFTDDDAVEFLRLSLEETPRYRRLVESYLDREGGDVDRTVQTMAAREYDDRGTIIQPRDAYIQNLMAQVRQVASLRDR